ncbi:MAG: hypothetical protein ACE10K_09160, partial [Rhodothermales bacterium]
ESNASLAVLSRSSMLPISISLSSASSYFDDALDDLWNNDIDVYRNRGRHRYLMGLFYLQE